MDPKGIQSIEVGYRLLEVLEQSPTPLPLKTLSERAGLSPSKARNYLVSLMRTDLVEQDAATVRYTLGPGALRLGLAALERSDPIEIAYDEMKRRRQKIGTTQFLSVWGNRGPAIVRWLEGDAQITVEVRTGSVLPATRSATGWVFLTHLPDAVSAPVVDSELAEFTVSKRGLHAHQKAIRKHGLGRIDGTLLPGIAGLAIPIFDHEDRIRAVVSAIGRRGAIDIDLDGPLAAALEDLKHAVEHRLGVAAQGRASDAMETAATDKT